MIFRDLKKPIILPFYRCNMPQLMNFKGLMEKELQFPKKRYVASVHAGGKNYIYSSCRKGFVNMYCICLSSQRKG